MIQDVADFGAFVKELAYCVGRQNEAIAKGNAAAGNAFARRYVAAFEKLRACGDGGRDALAALLSHERADVRVMAAVFLLRHCGEKAKAVLELEARGNGLVAFGAEQALRRWEEGTWEVDLA